MYMGHEPALGLKIRHKSRLRPFCKNQHVHSIGVQGRRDSRCQQMFRVVNWRSCGSDSPLPMSQLKDVHERLGAQRKKSTRVPLLHPFERKTAPVRKRNLHGRWEDPGLFRGLCVQVAVCCSAITVRPSLRINVDQTFALTQVCVSTLQLVRVPSHVPLELAMMTEPLSVALHSWLS